MFFPETIEGEWWLPEIPERRLRGTLVLSEHEFALHVEGVLLQHRVEPGQSYPIAEWVEIPVVYGTSRDAPVTLLAAAGISWYLAGTSATEVWHVGVGLVGALVDSETTYVTMTLSTEHLDDFVGTPSPELKTTNDDDGELQSIELRASQYSIASGVVHDVGRVEIGVEPTFHSGQSSVELGLQARMTMEFLNPVGHDAALTTAGTLAALSRIATCCECAITSLTLVPAGLEDAQVRVLRHMAAVGRPTCSRQRFGRCLFSARSLPSAEDTFNHWWNLRERHSQGWRLLTLLDDTRRVSVSERFNIYARALEALHQKDFGHPQVAVAERDERVQRALEAIPDDLVDWAEPLLEASTPPVFRHRVAELVTSLGVTGVLLAGEPGKFAHAVSATRNAVIHPEHKPSSQVLDQYWQYWVGSAMKWLGHAYLVRELGMPEAVLAQKLEVLPDAREVIDRMRERFADPQQVTADA